jgi:hypothetical protein
MAQMLACLIEDAAAPDGTLAVMLNLDQVLWLRVQPGQTDKTQVRLINGETLWLVNAFADVDQALQTANGTVQIAEAAPQAAPPTAPAAQAEPA